MAAPGPQGYVAAGPPGTPPPGTFTASSPPGYPPAPNQDWASAHHGRPPPPAPPPSPGPAAVYVATPKIEMQPWARNVWRWLADHTVGVARVDLRRPTPPLPEQYDGNLLVVRSRRSLAEGGGRTGRGGFTRRKGRESQPQYAAPVYGVPTYPAAVPPPSYGGPPPAPGQPLLMGARIKITRSFLVGGLGSWGRFRGSERDSSSSSSEEGEVKHVHISPPSPAPPPLSSPRPKMSAWSDRPLLDFGLGVCLDLDAQQIQPVARIKVKDLVSLKAFPMGMLKISRSIPLGPVALKVRYELPLAHAKRFWEPPARLMVRLDNAAGSGVHLTPGGLEFDEKVLRFGDAVSVRASAAVCFPRQLPLQDDEPPLRLQVHRLSLKSIW
ncbi:hypothetical protein HYH02_015003 [Chlamydomonas schloesseri]|uniref:Uncharacterized protein n=1 Tax=Chlamydomonas schloesseri TaxID=2026947 RepID=A0A835STK4_9CHLO|nr:hypothetical protein HYH02_015003 [Chlamydomonas schloesseri]|eukprot:KAG2425631.1 hypothetical protein HYH02_015003 [Chlamydomonas schloesseri]